MTRFRWVLCLLPAGVLGLAAVLAAGTWLGWVSWTRIDWIENDPLENASIIDRVDADGTIVLVTGERLWVDETIEDQGTFLIVSLVGFIGVDDVMSRSDRRAEIERRGRMPDGRTRARVWVSVRNYDWSFAFVTIPLRVEYRERWRKGNLFRYTGSRC